MAESGPQSRAVPRTHRAQPGDRIPISVRLNQKKYGVVAVHFFDLEAAGLADGDLVTLDIGGAQVGGMVWTDKGGPWLSKGPTDWSGRRRTPTRSRSAPTATGSCTTGRLTRERQHASA
jgi:hypothetical protein